MRVGEGTQYMRVEEGTQYMRVGEGYKVYEGRRRVHSI